VRGGAQADSVNFVNALVLDVFFQQVWSEDAAFQQELVIGFERVQYCIKGAGYLLDKFLLLCRQLIQIAILRTTRIDLVGDTVQASHEDGGESQIRVACWVWRAELNTFGFGALGGRDAADRGTIAL